MDLAALVDIAESAAATVRAGWCQYTAAVDHLGDRVTVRDPRAVRFCMVGAIDLVVYGKAAQLPHQRAAWRHDLFAVLAARLAARVDGAEAMIAGGRCRRVCTIWNDAIAGSDTAVADVLADVAADARRLHEAEVTS